ncbi:hypothetical protein ABFS83_13G026800 [Erythranthe nasuta]
MTPFEALYGYSPPQVGYGPHLLRKTGGVEAWVKDHQMISQRLKELLTEAHQRMKFYADQHRSEREFTEGEWVYLKLKPYKQMSLRKSELWKLRPKYCGPFLSTKRIGAVAYELQLPADAKVHPVFHVSELKKHVGDTTKITATLPPLDEQSQFLQVPVAVRERRLVKHNNVAQVQWLVEWAHLSVEEATWEVAIEMEEKFPSFKP